MKMNWNKFEFLLLVSSLEVQHDMWRQQWHNNYHIIASKWDAGLIIGGWCSSDTWWWEQEIITMGTAMAKTNTSEEDRERLDEYEDPSWSLNKRYCNCILIMWDK